MVADGINPIMKHKRRFRKGRRFPVAPIEIAIIRLIWSRPVRFVVRRRLFPDFGDLAFIGGYMILAFVLDQVAPLLMWTWFGLWLLGAGIVRLVAKRRDQ